jgi:hypothetical protein
MAERGGGSSLARRSLARRRTRPPVDLIDKFSSCRGERRGQPRKHAIFTGSHRNKRIMRIFAPKIAAFVTNERLSVIPSCWQKFCSCRALQQIHTEGQLLADKATASRLRSLSGRQSLALGNRGRKNRIRLLLNEVWTLEGSLPENVPDGLHQ